MQDGLLWIRSRVYGEYECGVAGSAVTNTRTWCREVDMIEFASYMVEVVFIGFPCCNTGKHSGRGDFPLECLERKIKVHLP